MEGDERRAAPPAEALWTRTSQSTKTRADNPLSQDTMTVSVLLVLLPLAVCVCV